jgi:hypothetical protein
VFSAPLSDPLTPTIRQWFDPIADRDAAADPADDGATLASYVRETAGLIDRICSALLLLDATKLAEAFKSDPTEHWDDTPEEIALPAALRERLAWSDVRSNVAAGRHRSRIWLL